jgi:hypothetical protein
MSLKQVAEYIEKNETEFLNEYGFYERWVIRDRFDLTQEDYAKLVKLLAE